MKHVKFIMGCLVILLLAKNPILAAEKAVVCEILKEGTETPSVYVKGIEGNIEDISAQVGSVGNVDVSCSRLSESGNAIDTLILIDNSLSIPKNVRNDILDAVLNVIAAREEGERFSIATYGESIEILENDSSDYVQLRDAINTIEFKDRETFLTDVLYDYIDSMRTNDIEHFQRILIISDGVDNKTLGYTASELETLISKNNIPIYTIGLYNSAKSNGEMLKRMFALSRLTYGEAVLYDESFDLSDKIINLFKLDRTIARFEIHLNDDVMDGSEKTITVHYVTNGSEYTVSVDNVRMPQKVLDEMVVSGAENNEKTEFENKEEIVVPDNKNDDTIDNSKTIIIVLGAGIILCVILCVFFIFKVIQREKNREKKNPVFEIDSNTDEDKTEIIPRFSEHNQSDSTLLILENDKEWILNFIDIDSPARTYQIPIYSKIIIGRSKEKADICIDYDKSVSNMHCKIERQGNEFFLSDLQSSNGTYLNDMKIDSEEELFSGGIIKIGRVRLRVEMS